MVGYLVLLNISVVYDAHCVTNVHVRMITMAKRQLVLICCVILYTATVNLRTKYTVEVRRSSQYSLVTDTK